jgi:hypothetical protein
LSSKAETEVEEFAHHKKGKEGSSSELSYCSVISGTKLNSVADLINFKTFLLQDIKVAQLNLISSATHKNMFRKDYTSSQPKINRSK